MCPLRIFKRIFKLSELDEIDLQILRILQQDGREKLNAIAEEVSLSLPSVRDRLKKIENQ